MLSNLPKKEYWRQVCERYVQSGLTKAEFCRQQKVSETQLYYWSSIIKAGASSLPQAPVNSELLKTRDLFIPLKMPIKSSVRVKLQNGIELEFSTAPDSSWMASFIRELGGKHVVA